MGVCFLPATLPSPPQDFHLVDTGIERLIFAWSKPRVHGEKATYDLFFKVKADTHYTKKDVSMKTRCQVAILICLNFIQLCSVMIFSVHRVFTT